ncbi:acyl-coenzyme A thioesterase 13-like, partial [Apis dorsata]|uniref:acyl-coenzyme A thioesterase 13-like n=1 Tax=Apis dorsata TaxID=7462 RepID=UPI00129328F7
ISEEHLNLYGLLHGGFTSTLIDAVSTYALITHEKNNKPGVSLNLDITFMKPALFGELITINARTIRVGKTVGFVSIDITKNEGKDIIVNGTHIKFIGK